MVAALCPLYAIIWQVESDAFDCLECFAALFGMKPRPCASNCLVQHNHAQNLRMPLRVGRVSPLTHIFYECGLANRNDEIPGGGNIGREGRRATVKVLRDIGFMTEDERIISVPRLPDQI